ncbi:pentapeptide repeat-containing protein [Clostridium perfringens]|nr:pentapeptide repeat-containing protein [Clostridium perfringens]
MNLSFSTLKEVEFKDCDLTGAVIQEANLKKVNFQNVNLKESIFRGTNIKDIDFRTCNIEDIDLNMENLKGGIFTAYQALELSKFLGIIIK